jgi:hypothetical protein
MFPYWLFKGIMAYGGVSAHLIGRGPGVANPGKNKKVFFRERGHIRGVGIGDESDLGWIYRLN